MTAVDEIVRVNHGSVGHGVNHTIVSTRAYGYAFRVQLVTRSEEVRLSAEHGCPEPACQIHEGKRCDSKLRRLSYSGNTYRESVL
jgi:hypothetical protein